MLKRLSYDNVPGNSSSAHGADPVSTARHTTPESDLPTGKNHYAHRGQYIIHKSRETLRWLKQKFRIIYQPVYSLWVNHIELLRQALHETITRNHQYRSMWHLLKEVRHFMETVSLFPG